MSKRNTLESKRERKNDRAYKATGPKCSRSPVAEIPLEVSADLLVNPKERMGRAVRRNIKRTRDTLVLVELKEPRRREVKNLLKLQTLPLTRLIREMQRTARRVSTAGYLMKNATLGSKYRARLEAVYAAQFAYLTQIKAEYEVRLNPSLKNQPAVESHESL